MFFDQWIQKQPRGTIARIYREHGISFATCYKARDRKPIGQYMTAKRLSEATGAAVSIDTLCDPAGRQKRRKAR